MAGWFVEAIGICCFSKVALLRTNLGGVMGGACREWMARRRARLIAAKASISLSR